MKYMGSKARHAKYLLPIIEKYNTHSIYMEPFCGGCNLIDKIHGIRYANDNNEYLIEMWKALQAGWIPPINVDEGEYKDIRLNKDKYPKYLVGYVGFNISYAGKWFGGYARDRKGKRNYCLEAFKNVTKQIDSIKGDTF